MGGEVSRKRCLLIVHYSFFALRQMGNFQETAPTFFEDTLLGISVGFLYAVI